MGAISTTSGATLPTAQGLFSSAGGVGTAPQSTSTSQQQVAGPFVQGVGGGTQLPGAAPNDFSGVNPTPLDQPHPQYPALIQSHVAVLQAIGTPETYIAQINDGQPQAEYLDRYIQGEIMQDPEGWDAVVGNQPGTARAGLQQLMPNVQLPAPGQGNPGYLPDGSPVSGVAIPGVSTPISSGPMLDPTTGMPNGSGLMTGLAIAGVVAGIGLIAWKVMKGRGGGDAAKEAQQIMGLAGGGAGGVGGGAGAMEQLGKLGELFTSGKIDATELASAQRMLSLQTMVGGGLVGDVAANAANTAKAATMDSMFRFGSAADGFVMSNVHASVLGNVPFNQAVEASLAHRGMGVLERLAANGGTVADLAAARVLTTQLGAAGAEAGKSASQLQGLRQALAGMANLAV